MAVLRRFPAGAYSLGCEGTVPPGKRDISRKGRVGLLPPSSLFASKLPRALDLMRGGDLGQNCARSCLWAWGLGPFSDSLSESNCLKLGQPR